MINDKIALICCFVRNHLLLWRDWSVQIRHCYAYFSFE